MRLAVRVALVSLAACGRAGFDATNAADAPLVGCVRSMTVHGNHACIARTDGQLWCWGSGEEGQLGDGTATTQLSPLRVALDDIQVVGSGEFTTCAANSTGGLWCWGNSDTGQVGDGQTMDRALPIPIPLAGDRVVALKGSQTHTCALLASGEGFCWGANKFGQLGVLVPDPRPEPAGSAIAGNLAFSVGDDSTCTIHPDHTLACWGGNDQGGLGDGTTTSRGFARRVEGIFDPVLQVAGGCHKHWCAVTKAGEVWCWGVNDSGQLGRGSTSAFETLPVRVPGLANAVQVAVGAQHSCARTTTNNVYCWGATDFGQAGSAPSPQRLLAPERVDGVSGVLVDLQAGCYSTMVLRADATVLAWGTSVVLGTGEVTSRYTPAEVPVPCP